ncbi:hypothetical protein FRAHR75_1970002 [Frankia sp. Hr75.2]|nr:hypothetical protein FRAHR75_1970002 [Frankia sp. Hr75.2]
MGTLAVLRVPPRVIVIGVFALPGVVVLLLTVVLTIVTAAHRTSPYPLNR